MESYSKDEKYKTLYNLSAQDPEAFWAEQAGRFVEWMRPWDDVISKTEGKTHAKWFSGGKLNVASNCLDRHLIKRGNKTAIIWEGDDPADRKQVTYRELYKEVCKFANVLKSLGVSKGDRVCIYMPNIIETAVAMLSCARLGAVHSVIFGGFSSNALKDRITDTQCKVIVTANEGMRGGKHIQIKNIIDDALQHCPLIEKVVVVKHTDIDVEMIENRDIWYHEAMEQVSDVHVAEAVESNDPLFILYTSGSTGKPKGILHSSAGYLLHCSLTFKHVFDYREDDVFWSTADLAWITGHSYVLYGPLSVGATIVLYEGVPTYPDANRYWDMIDRYKVNSLYTAPTILRTLVGMGDSYLNNSSRESLRILGSVGEPIDAETWDWYFTKVGKRKCPIVDTWWQTETGGIMLSQMPQTISKKCGEDVKPMFGIVPDLVDDNEKLTSEKSGNLVIKEPWPGQMLTIYNDDKRFEETYFTASKNGGFYLAGDRALYNDTGTLRVTGRADDTLNVAGHLIGATEVEAALIKHKAVAEAAVVGYPHPVKGQGIYAYVALINDYQPDEKMVSELMQLVKSEISGIAKPDVLHWTPELPKTRSGKVMRRILRKISNNEFDDVGDTSTLVNPAIVQFLISSRNQYGV
tara:strand:- start:38749 stop:40653 length:1905 start_codon:yes stop_codon:yes gene_type:complete